MAREEAEIKELSKKLAQNPDSMVFVQLADAYRRSGDLEKSVEVCLLGLERHPTYTTARSILGRNYLDLGKLDEAASEFRQIEVADPENIMAHRMLGQIYLGKGQFAEAIARQQKVLALDPDDTTAQELLQEALKRAKQHEGSPAVAVAPAKTSPATQASAEQLGTLKVAEIYIKKGALDEAAEVLQEILASDPGNVLAQQKLKEVNDRRGPKDDGGAADRKAAEDAAAKKASEEAAAKKTAEEAAAKKAAEEAAAKKAAEEAAAKKAAEEAAAKKAAEEAAAKKAAEEAAAKKAADEAAAKKAAEEAAAQKAAEAAAQKAEEEEKEKQRKAAKLSSEDILSVMAGSRDELIEDEAPAPSPVKSAAPGGLPAATKALVDDFIKAQAIEASLLMDAKGGVLDSRNADASNLGATAFTIFNNTEKAAQRMQFGGLRQIMIVGEDNRQILFVALKAGVLVALTGRNTNLGLLRVAVNDLVKRA